MPDTDFLANTIAIPSDTPIAHMSTSRTDSFAANGSDASPAASTQTRSLHMGEAYVDGESELTPLPPMLREPTRLPGQARRRFSPEQFYALSRVVRTDVSATDDGLWLTQAPCPTINPQGILFGDMLFWDPGLQPHVDVGDAAPARTYVIRYNRALYARGVLDELIVLEQDAAGGYHERCRCRPRDQVSQIDLNLVIAERERLTRVLLAKVAHAHEVRITLEQGAKAFDELRDEQARQRRIQRSTKRPPIAAAPIDPQSAREAHQARTSAQVLDLSARLQHATLPTSAAATATAEGNDPAGSGPVAPTPARRSRRTKADASTPRDTAAAPSAAPTSGSVAQAAPTGHGPTVTPTLLGSGDAAFVTTPPTPAGLDLSDSLGAQTGFVAMDDD